MKKIENARRVTIWRTTRSRFTTPKFAQFEETPTRLHGTAALLHDTASRVNTSRQGVSRKTRPEKHASREADAREKSSTRSEASAHTDSSDCTATIEAKIVYDADKLDSLGAFGIARAFHFAGRIGAVLHNTEQAALESKAYSREDSAYREYLVKLKTLPDRMMTVAGVKIARERAGYMRDFFERMNRGE